MPKFTRIGKSRYWLIEHGLLLFLDTFKVATHETHEMGEAEFHAYHSFPHHCHSKMHCWSKYSDTNFFSIFVSVSDDHSAPCGVCVPSRINAVWCSPVFLHVWVGFFLSSGKFSWRVKYAKNNIVSGQIVYFNACF